MDSIYEHEAEGAVERTRISDTRKSSVKFDLSYGDDANNSSMVHANKNQSNCLFKQSADSHKVVGSEKGKEKPILRVVSACPICGSDKPVHTCHVDDAVQAPVQSCKSSLDESALNSRSADDTELQAGEEPKSFVVIHLGCAVVDRRFPPKSIMPWVMAEVKRSRDTFKEVSLQVLSHTIKAISYEDSVSKSVCTVFEHKLHGLSRFAKTHQDPRCFGYLRRESLYSDFECHVFLANDEKVVGIS